MNDAEISAYLGIQNLPEEARVSTLQSVALGVEARIHAKATEILDDKQITVLQSKSQLSPEVVSNWLATQNSKLAKQYKTELTSYLEEKTKTTK